LFNRAVAVFQLRVEVDEPPFTPEEQAARLARPVIVLARHAGPGDSFLLIHQLLSTYHRKPRIVMKAALQFDPSIDVVINRLPHAFVHPHRTVPAPREEPTDLDGRPAGSRAEGGPIIHEIRRLAAGLDNTGALVIFPEGGNFTPNRWRRGIRRLEEARRFREAERARRMANLLPPRSGGAFAAIDAAPNADVIFVAHTGLDDLVTVGDVWLLWTDHPGKWWRVPAGYPRPGRGRALALRLVGTHRRVDRREPWSGPRVLTD
jgi:1-acyl-sn-glycerol-3-phosphate acyltransferase